MTALLGTHTFDKLVLGPRSQSGASTYRSPQSSILSRLSRASISSKDNPTVDASASNEGRMEGAAPRMCSPVAAPLLGSAKSSSNQKVKPAPNVIDEDDGGKQTLGQSSAYIKTKSCNPKGGEDEKQDLSHDSTPTVSTTPAVSTLLCSPEESNSFVNQAQCNGEQSHDTTSLPSAPRPKQAFNALHSYSTYDKSIEVPIMADTKLHFCWECKETISGAVFMLHDMPFCCQRHRLVAYHKLEKLGVKPQATPATTGLQATFQAWV